MSNRSAAVCSSFEYKQTRQTTAHYEHLVCDEQIGLLSKKLVIHLEQNNNNIHQENLSQYT